MEIVDPVVSANLKSKKTFIKGNFLIFFLLSRAPDSAGETRAPACQFFLCFLDPPPSPCAQGGG